MKYIQLLKEEILGNVAIVYHRGSERKLDKLLNQTYQNTEHIDFDEYDQALYTTTDVASQLNQVGNNNNMRDTYGDYIIKLAVKGISNFWFCNYNQYSKYNHCTIDNWKEQQFNKFNIPTKDREKLSGEKKDRTANHSIVSSYFEKYNLLPDRIKGIQYWGPNDGNCLLIYDWITAVPLAFSKDECKTWEKIDKNKTQFSRNNFKNNDYIDTNKKIKFNFVANRNGNINCSYNKLTNLQGAPKEIGGNFNCSNNQLTNLQGAPEKVGGIFNCSHNKLTTLQRAPKKVGGDFHCAYNQLTSLQGGPKEVGGDFFCYNNELTNLQGAPEKVGGNFGCSYNKLTTLQGAPKEVGGGFYCRDNLLTKQEIVRYLKTAKIDGYISTDCGSFNSQQEAIEKLSQLNEELNFQYFNY